MVTIVDYDNLPGGLRAKGPRSVIERLCEVLAPLISPVITSITFKLYGGWYAEASLTQPAQVLHSALYDDFPFIWTIATPSPRKLSVTASLAHALEVNPKQILPHTFRVRNKRRRGRWEPPADSGCIEPNCPLSPVIKHFQSDRCWIEGCAVRPSSLVSPEPEQKMVDTMMVADIIYIANRGDEAVAIVTSDDDIWPGIISALINGTRILHVQPKPSLKAWPYQSGGNRKYTAIEL